MSPFRTIGYIGLAVLSLLGLLCIYISISENDWHGVAIGLGMLVLFAVLGNMLWYEGFKQKRPYVTVAPNKTILGLFLVVLSIFSGAVSIEGFMSSHWLSATISLFSALCLLEGAYYAFKRT